MIHAGRDGSGAVAALMRQQATLARFGQLALRSQSLDEILSEACGLVSEALGTDLAKVLELQEDDATLLVRSGVGWKPGVVGHIRVPAEEASSAGHALLTGEPVVSSDIDRERRFSVPDFLRDNGVRALVNVVIIGGEGRRPYGVLEVDSRTPRQFGDDDIAFLRTYANLLAAAVDRLRALEETRRNAAFFRGVLKASPDWIKVLDADGTLRFMNEDGLGLGDADAPAGAIGRDFAALWPAEEAGKIRTAIADASAGKVTRAEGYCPTAQGTPRWWEVSFAPMPDADGQIRQLVGVSRDITARHRAQLEAETARAQLYVEREFLDTLIRKAPIGISITDAATGASTVLNDFAKKMLGHDELGVSEERYRAYGAVHADGRPYAIGDYPTMRALRCGETVREELMIYRYGGAGTHGTTRRLAVSSTPVRNADGAIVAAMSIVQDIENDLLREEALQQAKEQLETEVERGTQDLRDSRDFARLALSAVGGVGVWTFDAASGHYVCSEAIAELYGLDPERAAAGVIRAEFLGNVHPADADRLAALLADGDLHSGSIEMEYRIRHPDGSLRWVLSRSHTYTDGAGRMVRRVGIGVETTSQRQLEEQLRQSQKMEAVGQLTGGLAHDFNNLLTGITGSLELLQARVTQGRFNSLDRYIAAAQGAAGRAAALTHRLLAFSRRQTLAPTPTDVNRLVVDLEELVRRTVGPSIAVEVAGGPGLWPALVDPNQLENALLNLCINARDAMPDGGRLTIETGHRIIDAGMARDLEMPPGEYLTLSVTDNGSGMPPEVIARAFDPFFTTKPIGQGTGLGLSMIYGFARQSGGQVRIYSELGQGTTVCLYLPPHYGDAVRADAAPALSAAPRTDRGETVLVVDDEPTVRMLVAEVLDELGYITLEAQDGAAGLHVLRSDARIDLLVTDVGLPGGMNGRQVADAGRALRPDLKVLFITGYAENAVLSHGHLDPGMQVMTKPFAMEGIASRIREMLRSS